MQRCYFFLILGLTVFMVGSGLAGRAPETPDAARCPEPEARQFDFWLGAWTIDNRQRSPSRPADPTWLPTGTLRTHVASILDGCAIVEQSWGELVYGPVSGFSLRAFDPEKQRWMVVNNWSVGGMPPSFSTWEGTFHHGRIEGFDTTQTSFGALLINRSTFSDITDSTFRWDAATSTDGMLTWKPRWIMEGRRVEAEEAEIFPFALPETPPPCPDSVVQAVDELRGTWHGTVTLSADPALPAGARTTLEAHSLHGGCALFTQLTVATDAVPYQRVAVRAPDPASGQWVQYSLDTRSRAFARMEGSVHALRVGIDDTTGQPTDIREVWSVPDADHLFFRREARASREGRWQPRVEMRWTRQPH